MDKDLFDVAVVGAGVVGAASALGCAQLGLKVAWVGPAPQPFVPSAQAPFDRRIYALSPGSVALAERLKVWAAMPSAQQQAVMRMQVFGDASAQLVFDAYEACAQRLATIVQSCDLERAFQLGCSFAPAITRFEVPAQCMRFEHAQTTVQLDSGQVLRAGFVVGADGLRSEVRAAAGINAQERLYGQSAIVTNFACERPHRATAFQWFTPQGVIALLPLPACAQAAHAVSLVWSAPQDLAEALRPLAPQDLAKRLAEVLGDALSQALGALRPLGPSAAFELRCLSVGQLVAPRVALVGDAAHVVHPLAGQGLNLGLKDVAVLLDVLAAREAFRPVGDVALLRRYARARAQDVALMRLTTDALARTYESQDPLIRLARGWGMSFVNRMAPLKRALVHHAMG